MTALVAGSFKQVALSPPIVSQVQLRLCMRSIGPVSWCIMVYLYCLYCFVTCLYCMYCCVTCCRQCAGALCGWCIPQRHSGAGVLDDALQHGAQRSIGSPQSSAAMVSSSWLGRAVQMENSMGLEAMI